MRSHPRGFTMIELMIAIGLIGILLAIAGPSFRDYIVTQRLKAVTAQLVTDLQYARSESASRSRRVFVHFQTGSGALHCYTIYVDQTDRSDQCDCTQAPGSACGTATRELRTVQLTSTDAVRLALPGDQPTSMSFDPLSGGVYVAPSEGIVTPPNPYQVATSVDASRKLQVVVSLGGQPAVCLPTGATLSGGYHPC